MGMFTRSIIILIAGLLMSSFLTLSLLSQSAFANENIASPARENTLVFGVISSNPKKAFKRTQPIADYLALNLSSQNISSARIVVAKNVEQMKRWLKNGQVDLLTETVFSAYELMQSVEAQLLARRWKSGVGEYSTVFFSRKNSGVDSLADLIGKTIVFEDRGSTSSFLIPASILIEQGYELYELTSPREIPPQGKIGYFFSDEFSRKGGESNMMSWVHRNIVAAAAFSNIDWNKEIPEQVQQQLQIFYTSQPVPRSLMLARPDMPVELKDRLTELLLTAHEDELGKKALAAYKKTKKFDAISPDILATIEWVGDRKMLLSDLMTH